MIGFKKVCLLTSFVGSIIIHTNNIKCSMEISDWLKNNDSISNCIMAYFETLNSEYKNPIFPYKINYKSTVENLTFCSIPIVESWLLKSNKNFTFFMLIKGNQNLVASISKKFGEHDTESSSEINGIPNAATYYWDKGFNIILRPYLNTYSQPKYQSCYLIIIGNMNYESIIQFPDNYDSLPEHG